MSLYKKYFGSILLFIVCLILTIFFPAFLFGCIAAVIMIIKYGLKVNKINKDKSSIKQNNVQHDSIPSAEKNQMSQKVNNLFNEENINDTDAYLKSFDEVNKYDMNKEISDDFYKKILRTKDAEYDKFVKPSGTTSRPDSFVVFDLETTGLSATKNEIIEIGAIKYDSDMPIEIFHTYVKPEKKITAKITAINGITNDMVADSPTIDKVIPRFLDFIGDDVLVAHNSNFDMGFILNKLYELGYKKLKNKVIDTLKLSRQKVREFDYDNGTKLDSYKLENLKYEFGLFDLDSHNAIDDCKVCGYVYMKIKSECGDKVFV